VPTGIILGIWGIESNFGGFTGIRPTIAALATLAWIPGARPSSGGSSSMRSKF
jgi:membrane-bound lytic murein transglycosylase B